MNLGSRLKQILKDRGLTVTRFSEEAGIPAQTVYALINRDSNKADMDILMKMLSALQMDLFTFMDQESPIASTEGDAAGAAEKIVEKIVEKEVSAAAPEGKTALFLDTALYEQLLALAAEEGITDPDIISQAIDTYFEQGFGYRQAPFRSIFRDLKPKGARKGEMDSFLL